MVAAKDDEIAAMRSDVATHRATIEELHAALENTLEKAAQDSHEVQRLREEIRRRDAADQEEKRRREEAARRREEQRTNKEVDDLLLSMAPSPSHYDTSSKMSTKGGALSKASRFQEEPRREGLDIPSLSTLRPQSSTRARSPTASPTRASSARRERPTGSRAGSDVVGGSGLSSSPSATAIQRGRPRRRDFSPMGDLDGDDV